MKSSMKSSMKCSMTFLETSLRKTAYFLACSIFSLPVLAGSDCENDQMNLQINHIEEIKGDFFVALHNSGDTYLVKDSEPYRSTVAAVETEGSQQVSICDVEAGEYAVAIFQYENRKGELDSNFIGIPKEPYGFSNNLKKLRPPSFEEASFEYDADEVVVINLK
jgi:uncharacterized protein (DUF2141 family)